MGLIPFLHDSRQLLERLGEGFPRFPPTRDTRQLLSFFVDLCISPSFEELREGPEILDDIRP